MPIIDTVVIIFLAFLTSHGKLAFPELITETLDFRPEKYNGFAAKTVLALLKTSSNYPQIDTILITDTEAAAGAGFETWTEVLEQPSAIYYSSYGKSSAEYHFPFETANRVMSASTTSVMILFVVHGRNLSSSLSLVRQIASCSVLNSLITLVFNPDPVSTNSARKSSAITQLVKKSFPNSTLASNVFILHSLSTGEGECVVDVEEVYNIQGNLITSRISGIPISALLDVMLFKTSRRSNFRNSNITAITNKFKIYNHTRRDFEPDQMDKWNEFYKHLFIYLRDALNFEIRTTPTKGAPSPWPNGTLKGSAEQLFRDEAQIDIAGTDMVDYRVNASNGVAYLPVIYSNRLYAYFTQLPRSSARDTFIQPFAKDLWVSYFCCWLAILIASSIGLIVGKWAPFIQAELLVWSVGSIAQQGWHEYPKSFHARVIFLVSSATFMLMFIAYSAVFTAIMSVDTQPIQVYGDLLKYNYRIGGDSRNPASVLVANGQSINIGPTMPMPEGFLKSQVAIISTVLFNHHLIEIKYTIPVICRTISRIPVSGLLPRKTGFIVKKGSPLREYFNYKLSVAKERGILSRLTQHRQRSNIHCDPPFKMHFVELTLYDVVTPVILGFAGFCLSLLVFHVECFWRMKSIHRLMQLEYCP